MNLDSRMSSYPNLKVLLEDFCEKLVTLTNYENSWLYKALNSSVPETQQPLTKLDEAAALIIAQGKHAVLKEKFDAILSNAKSYEINNEPWKPIYDYKFLDVVVEIIGFKYFYDKGYVNIKFVPESSQKTPDLEAMESGESVLIECKNCHPSNEEVQYLKGGSLRPRNVEIPTALITKLKDKICRGRLQLNEYEQQLAKGSGSPYRKIIFLQVTFDSKTMVGLDHIQTEGMREILNGEKNQLSRENIRLIVIKNYDSDNLFLDS